MKRYWITFDFDGAKPPYRSPMYGVTGHSLDDVLAILQEQVFQDVPMPQPKQVIEDIDVSTLDPNHVLPNLGVPSNRGVWYPTGYSWMR